MTATLRLFLRKLTPSPDDPDAHVHFHRGPQGKPVACHDAGCPMPRLEVG
jgi:hypothetical protein